MYVVCSKTLWFFFYFLFGFFVCKQQTTMTWFVTMTLFVFSFYLEFLFQFWFFFLLLLLLSMITFCFYFFHIPNANRQYASFFFMNIQYIQVNKHYFRSNWMLLSLKQIYIFFARDHYKFSNKKKKIAAKFSLSRWVINTVTMWWVSIKWKNEIKKNKNKIMNLKPCLLHTPRMIDLIAIGMCFCSHFLPFFFCSLSRADIIKIN